MSKHLQDCQTCVFTSKLEHEKSLDDKSIDDNHIVMDVSRIHRDAGVFPIDISYSTPSGLIHSTPLGIK